MDDAHDLSSYRWKNRLLLIFSPKASGVYKKQVSLIESQEEGVRERDLIVLHYLEEESNLSPQFLKNLQERFGVQPGQFVVVLVGKDGSEKQRFHEPVEMQEVFAIIDSMPMRQSEMRSQD